MELYFAPLSGSLPARIVAAEADIPLALHEVDTTTGILTATGAPYRDVNRAALVPALRLDDGALLTEVVAVVQYLADLRPATGLAPPWGSAARYQLTSALSYIATELHKRVLWPQFNGAPEAVRAHAREAAPRVFDALAHQLGDRAHLVGDRFTAADAYLVWALHLARLAGLDVGDGRPALAAYLARQRVRPAVTRLIAEETPLALAARARPPAA